MQIKQFSGATIDEVLTKVREELGEEAVILQTKRVVTGGLGGFFGREGVEVTAAEGMPVGERERANREAAASVAAAAMVDTTDEVAAEPEAFVPTPFRRHLDTRLDAAVEAQADAPPLAAPATPSAAYARAGAPFAPGERERTEAIIAAARAAVRDAHEGASTSEPDFGVPAPDPEPAPTREPDPTPAREPEATPAREPEPAPASAASAPPATRADRAEPIPPVDADTPAGTLEGVHAGLVRSGVDPRYLDPFIDAARAAVREAREPAASPEPAPPAEPEVRIRAVEPDPANDASLEIGWDEPVGQAATRRGGRSSGALEGVRTELVRAGVDPRYLDPFIDGFARSAAPFLEARDAVRDAVREHLAARLPVNRDWKARPAGHTVAFVGQSGVGKTSAAASLAGRYRAAGLTVTLVAAGPGPHDVLEAHARRMDIQLFRAPDGETLARLRGTLVDRDLVVVDTAGRSHQQLAEIEDLAALLGSADIDDVVLTLPVATPLADLGDVQRRFRMVGVNRIALTKLDETRHLGNLVNVSLRMGKPLAYVSDGTAVPGALAPADPRRVAEMILP